MKNSTLLLIPCVVALLGGCGGHDIAETERKTPPIAVRTTAAAPRPFERRLTVQGTLEAKHFANVAARVGGNLDAIWVDEGDRIVAGETVLFQVDPASLSNQVTMAKQALAVARSNLAVARADTERIDAEARKAALDFERYTRLRKEQRVSDNEYEQVETLHAQAQAAVSMAAAQVRLAQSRVDQSAAALEIARKDLADARILAPISGVISKRLAEPGEQVAVGQTVLVAIDPTVLEAAAFLPAQYYDDVQPGVTRFRLGFNNRDAGMHAVTYRGPTIDIRLRTFEIKGLIDNADGQVVPGAMVDMTLVFDRRVNLGVPRTAILWREGKPVVFVLRDNLARMQAVETGYHNDAWTEILSGLSENDPVVIEGQTQLRDADPVSRP